MTSQVTSAILSVIYNGLWFYEAEYSSTEASALLYPLKISMKLAINGKGGLNSHSLAALRAKIVVESGYPVIDIKVDSSTTLPATSYLPHSEQTTPVINRNPVLFGNKVQYESDRQTIVSSLLDYRCLNLVLDDRIRYNADLAKYPVLISTSRDVLSAVKDVY